MTNYKGYVGQFSVDTETGLIRGKVVNTRDVITFHGATVEEAKQAFRDSVDEYLAFCESLGEAPEKPYSGKLLVRLTPKVHQELDILAKLQGKSINTLVSGYLTRMARRVRTKAFYGEKTPVSEKPGSLKVRIVAKPARSKKAASKNG